MERQLRQGGGIMDVVPREAALFGGLKKAIKKVTKTVKNVAKSPVGKAAMLYFAPSLIPGGAKTLGGVFQNMGGMDGILSNIFKAKKATDKISGAQRAINALKVGSAVGGLSGLLAAAEQGDEEAIEATTNVESLRRYLTSSYTNLGYDPAEIPALVERDVSEYTAGQGGYATGGRVNFNRGSLGQRFRDYLARTPTTPKAAPAPKAASAPVQSGPPPGMPTSGILGPGGELMGEIGTYRKILQERKVDPNLFNQSMQDLQKAIDDTLYIDYAKELGRPELSYDALMKMTQAEKDKLEEDYNVSFYGNILSPFHLGEKKRPIGQTDFTFSGGQTGVASPRLNKGGRVGYAEGADDEGIKSIIIPKKPKFQNEKDLEKTSPGLARGELGEPLPGRNESSVRLNKLMKMYNNFKMAMPGMSDKGASRDLFKNRLREEYEKLHFLDKEKFDDFLRQNKAKGGRIGYAMGDSAEDNAMQAAGIMDLPLNRNKAGVTELDLRKTGGFIPPVGIKEKADDIPAMLSNNEFVFTADAVRGMGDGNVNLGAQRMYDMMKKLENGGRV